MLILNSLIKKYSIHLQLSLISLEPSLENVKSVDQLQGSLDSVMSLMLLISCWIAAMFLASIKVQIWSSSIFLWEIRIPWPKDTGTFYSLYVCTNIWLHLWNETLVWFRKIYHIQFFYVFYAAYWIIFLFGIFYRIR